MGRPRGHGGTAGRLWPRIGLLLTLAWPFVAAADNGAPTVCTPHKQAQLQRLHRQQLADYERHFPAIQFVTLPGAANWSEAMTALDLLLGYRPTVLDYEHPADVATLLLEVSLERIALLMQHQIPGAALFQVGEQAVARRPRVCVITLDACAIAGDDQRATDLMAGPPCESLPAPAGEHLLDAHATLRFVIDHEVYHCLDAHANGGMPRGYDSHWGEYWRTRNEMAADAFAVAAHLARTGRDGGFVTKLARLRGLALLAGDPQHFTFDAIEQVRRMDAAELAAMSPQQRLALARRIGAQQLGDYPRFVRFWASAYQAMAELGVTATVEGNQGPAPGSEPDRALSAHMLAVSRRAEQQLRAP